MTAYTTPSGQLTQLGAEYRAGVIADELAIAKLLRWGNLPTFESALQSDSRCMFGTNGGERGLDARLARTFLPRWRRDWDAAGELIGRCQMEVDAHSDRVWITCRRFGDVLAYADHPTRDDAIRAAICKAAIAYLTAERESKVAA